MPVHAQSELMDVADDPIQLLINPGYGGKVKSIVTSVAIEDADDGDDLLICPLRSNSVLLDVSISNPAIAGATSTVLQLYEGETAVTGSPFLSTATSLATARANFNNSLFPGAGTTRAAAFGQPLWKNPVFSSRNYESDPSVIWNLGLHITTAGANSGTVLFRVLYTQLT